MQLNQLGDKYDASANDSDKTFIVPTNTRWLINWIHIALVTTATVGNRQIKLEILDAADNVRMDSHAGVVQAASLTRHYEYMKGIFREAAFIDDAIQVPLPTDLAIPAGWKVRVYDSAAVDAAADDMTVSIQYQYD